jgi:GcrA cell cycle regulator
MLQQVFTWTEANIGLLKEMVASGMSASQAAAKLRCSRNAIIGKAHRLGISFGHSRGAPTKPKPEKKQTQAPKTPWTPERIEKAAQMWRDGKAAEAIANAVGCSLAALHFTAGKYREQFPMRNLRRGRATNVAETTGHTFTADSVPFLLPNFPSVRFEDLEPRHCKFPVSNDHGPDMLCCGADRNTSGPYCAVHAMVARGRGTESERKAMKIGRAW